MATPGVAVPGDLRQAKAEIQFPKLTVPMNRADPFFERDATGWQFIDVASGARHEVQPLQQHEPRRGLQPEDRQPRTRRSGSAEPGRTADPLLERVGRRERCPGRSPLSSSRRRCRRIAGGLAGGLTRAPTSSPRRISPLGAGVHERGPDRARAVDEPVPRYNGVACAQCHRTRPTRTGDLSQVPAADRARDPAPRDDQLVHPAAARGKPLALDDPRMVAMEAYVAYERRGVAMAPGKH